VKISDSVIVICSYRPVSGEEIQYPIQNFIETQLTLTGDNMIKTAFLLLFPNGLQVSLTFGSACELAEAKSMALPGRPLCWLYPNDMPCHIPN
jgi:hypothetical protein